MLLSSSKNDFALPEIAQGIPIKQLRNSSSQRVRIIDEVNEIITLKVRRFFVRIIY
jgi:hypothetical protein